jgi:signal transduction histidine kinase
MVNEFDKAMISKAGLLETLISEDTEEVEFDFADEFMPEFSGLNDPEYYQLWLNGEVFERSKTLELFEIKDLPKLQVKLHQASIVDITLPDGRPGRMYFTKLIPQIDSDIEEEFGINAEEFSRTQEPVELAYAVSNESLNQVLWFVDITFIITSIIAVVIAKIIVSKVVERGLKPLDELNDNIRLINLNSKVDSFSTQDLPIELLPIATGINHFIMVNKALYLREKRITSDIAHELKTPISELLNLSEVATKFPQDQEIASNFTEDVLHISLRLKNVVNGILQLHKSTSETKVIAQSVNIEEVINKIIERENTTGRVIELSMESGISTIKTNQFAISLILTNLVSNALHYSVDDSAVSIDVRLTKPQRKININVSNVSSIQYTEQELKQFFEPFWQKDSSRTSAERFGLGLAIAHSYCKNIDATLAVHLEKGNRITFSLEL